MMMRKLGLHRYVAQYYDMALSPYDKVQICRSLGLDVALCKDALNYVMNAPNSVVKSVAWELNQNVFDIPRVAALHGRIDLLEIYFDTNQISGEIWSAAVESRCFKTLEWISVKTSKYSTMITEAGARLGYINVLEWANVKNIPMSGLVAPYAAQYGHIHVLKWLSERRATIDCYASAHAAMGNQLDTIKWLRDNGYPWNYHTINYAIDNVIHWDILHYAFDNNCPVNSDAITCAIAAGSLELIEWLRQRGCNLVDSHMFTAVYHNQVQIIDYLMRNSCPVNADIILIAKSIESMRCLHEYGFEIHEYMYGEFIASNCEIQILQYLYNNGVKPYDELCITAISYGNIKALRWLLDHGCYSDVMCVVAAQRMDKKILQWLCSAGYNHLGSELLERAGIEEDDARAMSQSVDLTRGNAGRKMI